MPYGRHMRKFARSGPSQLPSPGHSKGNAHQLSMPQASTVYRARRTPSTHRIRGWRPAVVAEVIVRHPLDPVRLTEYGSPWGQQEQSVA
jgi:hypothetical protein